MSFRFISGILKILIIVAKKYGKPGLGKESNVSVGN